MTFATFRDFCIDTTDAAPLGAWWAPVLGLRLETWDDDPDVALRGPNRHHTIWFNTVPEPKTVKNRVHVDVRAPSLEPFADLERVPVGDDDGWTTFRDPQGGEFCVFVSDDVPDLRLKAIEVDSVDPRTISAWWHRVLGGDLSHTASYSSVEHVPGFPEQAEGFDFGAVPELKTVKNRVHWDVDLLPGVTVDDLLALGATVVDEQERWTVLGDPEGNEFCAFPHRDH